VRWTHASVLAPLFALAALAVPSSASLTIPDPARSIVPPSLRGCPAGDLDYKLIVRSHDGSVLPGVLVLLDLSGCAGIHGCPGGLAPGVTFPTATTIQLTTNTLGEASLSLTGTGLCAGSILVYAGFTLLTDGVNHMPVAVSNVDQSGDFVVGPEDVALLAAKSPTDPTADFNYDGVHDAVDAQILLQHLGHQCAVAVPVSRSSWGALKLHYR
jgi:hypothetical protein